MSEHYTDGRRWSHISQAWILETSWNDKEEIAAQRQRIAQLEGIIKQHDLCHDLHGKVGREEFEEGCRRETVKQYGSCGWKERIAQLEAEVARLTAMQDVYKVAALENANTRIVELETEVARLQEELNDL